MYRAGFNDYWTWDGNRWRRADDFIGARQILAVDIDSIRGNFSEKLTVGNPGVDGLEVVGGTLRVNRAYADNLRSWERLAVPSRALATSVVTVNLSSPYSDFDWLAIVGSGGNSSTDGFPAVVPIKTNQIPITGFRSWAMPGGDFGQHTMRIQGVSGARSIRLWEQDSSEDAFVDEIWGIAAGG